ncbi:hypothetical protein EIU59_22020 [Salmonella enterica]|uniref:Uncharacterized protein n=1 Tax=Salmonella muenchen TaxID=596 RepID=A0A5X5AKI4_SALMU|nr:hypothetical protein [Salmonella enterica]EBS1325739.1 hypothetical protein [Salmonella enterica subsp. enterica serovar Muenchen]ECC3619088.1 hypothetical protein [Salmonella enterica subsp. enterica]EAP0005067.1 hypothetical protein [Salmonella enterica]EAP6102973.1 hypothetical protein [Salmonella enterica]
MRCAVQTITTTHARQRNHQPIRCCFAIAPSLFNASYLSHWRGFGNLSPVKLCRRAEQPSDSRTT